MRGIGPISPLKTALTAIACFTAALFMAAPAVSETPDESLPDSAPILYEKACAACHGSNGKGLPADEVGFDLPLPNFTDCKFGTREGDVDWDLVVAKGGPARGFSTLMPAFEGVLTPEQIQLTIDHVRAFCTEPFWPRGELNLPRALVTTKAFPEDELVIEIEVDPEREKSVWANLIFEKRVGKRGQVEVAVPYGFVQQPRDNDGNSTWKSGVGDIVLGAKYAVYASLDTGAIVSLGTDLILPTGHDKYDLGSGVVKFEPYLAYGQILPYDLFFQSQIGIELPIDRDKGADPEGIFRFAAGQSWFTGKYGRRWTPQVELVGAQPLNSSSGSEWAVVPQLQVTLNHRQNVRLAAGAEIPVNFRDRRETVYMCYILWDWFDGMFWEGW